jgi:hypothetical protein
VTARAAIGRAVSRVPILNWRGRAIGALSGATDVLNRLSSDPRNPFLHKSLLVTMARSAKLRTFWNRVKDFHSFGHTYVIREGVNALLDVIDGPQSDPEIKTLFNIVITGTAALADNPENDSVLVLVGVACIILARRLDDPAWLLRAQRAFSLVCLRSRNLFLVADACKGLAIVYSGAGGGKVSQLYSNKRLHQKCSGTACGLASGPSPCRTTV